MYMKKSFLFLTVIVMVFVSSCEKTSQEGAYIKYESDTLSIEYPKSWETELYSYSFRPFVAASNDQIITTGVRKKQDVTLDSFVVERINSFESTQWGFRLLEKEVKDGRAVIKYVNEADGQVKLGTIMHIYDYGDSFYGIDCIYETDQQKDTAEYIMNSIKLKR